MVKKEYDPVLHSVDSEFKYSYLIVGQIYLCYVDRKKIPTLNMCLTKMFTFQTTLSGEKS